MVMVTRGSLGVMVKRRKRSLKNSNKFSIQPSSNRRLTTQLIQSWSFYLLLIAVGKILRLVLNQNWMTTTLGTKCKRKLRSCWRWFWILRSLKVRELRLKSRKVVWLLKWKLTKVIKVPGWRVLSFRLVSMLINKLTKRRKICKKSLRRTIKMESKWRNRWKNWMHSFKL